MRVFKILMAAALAMGGLFSAVTAQAATREMNMTIDEMSIAVAPDLNYKVFAFNRQVPGPLIHAKEGDDLVIHVTNNTSLPHTIHWHGFHQMGSWRMDGVPGITQQPIKPGTTFTYKMKADRPGTLWYHCHVNVNEHVGIRGMWGPIIIDPKNPTALEKTVDHEVIMMLSTWESKNAMKYGTGGTPYDTDDYFSVNGRSFPYNQPVRLKTGEVVRIRFVGAGGAIHSMHIHGHDWTITHKDGLPLASPYKGETQVIAPGERYDAIYTANHKEGRFIFHDHVDKHVTAGGKFPGGPLTVQEYEGTPVDDWYVWKDVNYDPDFYYTESMKKGYGLFEQPKLRGTPIKTRRRGHE
ncbi:MAG: multicopper oxidase domain-containing protein [Mariprofundus sp.]|nr:multicopper oxidase domain-containing protein [Mariprofundus sp.]